MGSRLTFTRSRCFHRRTNGGVVVPTSCPESIDLEERVRVYSWREIHDKVRIFDEPGRGRIDAG